MTSGQRKGIEDCALELSKLAKKHNDAELELWSMNLLGMVKDDIENHKVILEKEISEFETTIKP